MRTALKFIIIVLLSVFILLEVFLRINGKYNTFYEDFGGEYWSHYDVGDADWFRLPPPNMRDTTRTSEYVYPKNTNSFGLRDEEHPIKKDSAEFRFIGLGDSFTECWGAPEDSTWTKLLADKLRALDQIEQARGIQAGVSGSDPFFGYILLKHKLIQYDPDLVIYATNTSDIDDVMLRGGMERFQPDTVLTYGNAPKIEKFYKYSHVVRFIAHEIMHYNYLLIKEKELHERRETARHQILSVFKELDELLEAQGKVFLVVLHPLYNELEGNSYVDQTSLLKADLLTMGIDMVDLMPYFIDNYEMDQHIFDYYWPEDAHHNSKGYDAFATGIFDYCKQAYLESEQIATE